MNRRDAAGFTLLEVMGAVVILGIVATSLMTASINSTRIAGDARDRLRASLLADSIVAEIESTATSPGGAAAVDTGDREIDGYTVSVSVDPVDAASIGLEGLVARERGEPEAAVLAGDPRGGAPLSRVRVIVKSPSGIETTRVTFSFDPSAAPGLAELAEATAYAEQAEPNQ